MSELINARDNRATIRWKLLTGASAFALTAYVSSTGVAMAEDTGHSMLWIELGGQFDSLTDPAQSWIPSNLPSVIDHPVTGILAQRPKIGYDIDASITLQPAATDWSFSASIKYGRARRGPKFAHDQAYKTHETYFSNKYAPTTYAFTDLHKIDESKHAILDFTAGKDVGLGLFGGHGSADVNFGVRMAHFSEKRSETMTAQISAPFKYPRSYYYGTKNLKALLGQTRSFSGIGPTLSWNGSVPIAGSLEDGLAIDWGANAALLFGRQKAKIQTDTNEEELLHKIIAYHTHSGAPVYQGVFTQLSNFPHTYDRSKSVMVPNLGGLMGLSFRKGDAKISFGYKADFFFGAIDGGIATAKKENRGFYGPFASISIGIGD